MKKPNGRTMAAIAVAVGAITYGVLTLLAPHHREEVTLEGLVPAESVFGDKVVAAAAEVAQAPAAVPAAEPAAPAPTEIAAETVGSDMAPPPDEREEAAAKAPATPAPAPAATAKPEPVPAPAPAVKPEPKPEPKPAPPPAKPAPKAEPPAPPVKPAAKLDEKKVEAKKAPEKKAEARKPAEKKAAPVKPETPAATPRVPAVAWWINQSPGALQISYVGSAAFKRAIVIMAGGSFASAAAADQHIAVLAPDGRRMSGQWELSPANRSMLVFSIPESGQYQVIIGGALSDQQNRSIGSTLRGAVQVQ